MNKAVFIYTQEQINSYDNYNGNSLSIGFTFPEMVYSYCDFILPYSGPLFFTKTIIILKEKKIDLKPDSTCTFTGSERIKVEYWTLEDIMSQEIACLKVKNVDLQNKLKKIIEVIHE